MALLFLSAIGTTLFFSAIPIYLRSLGLSTALVALMVASTALPNMLLGSAFGRWVDKSPKKRLFLGLSVALALMGRGSTWFRSHACQSLCPEGLRRLGHNTVLVFDISERYARICHLRRREIAHWLGACCGVLPPVPQAADPIHEFAKYPKKSTS